MSRSGCASEPRPLAALSARTWTLSRSGSSGPSGVAKALAHTAKGRVMGAWEVPSSTNVSMPRAIC